MPPRPFILVVNGRKVRQPVFVIGAPHSGADLLAHALKRTPGFHVTIGQPSVLTVVYAFARTPSIQRGRGDAVASVLRDAFAQGWQVAPHACMSCLPQCQQARDARHPGTCVDERQIQRYADASPALLYCAEPLAEAFPDARIVQIIRDGRDVVAAMLADQQELSWFRPGVENVGTEFPNPFFGIETEADRGLWQRLTPAGKCAMRWRGSVRRMARLRAALSAEQLTTFRYEQAVAEPRAMAAALSEFVGARVGPWPVPGRTADGWRHRLADHQITEVQRVAGEELRRIGYGT